MTEYKLRYFESDNIWALSFDWEQGGMAEIVKT